MTSTETAPRPPGLPQRLTACVRPVGKPILYQRWRDLLFLHWEYPAAAIQETLPAGLFVDTFGGKAYLGIVRFFMENIRPRFLPAVPGLSSFMEVNVRTYVYDRAGVPGVWFFSLDANQRLAVAIARRFFHLPYERAEMQSQRTASGAIRYRSVRAGGDPNGGCSVFVYAAGAEIPPPAPGSLECFLVERYRLYANAGGRLRRCSVFHEPYPLCRAEVTVWDERLLALDGFPSTGRPPDHITMSHGVDVSVFPLEGV